MPDFVWLDVVAVTFWLLAGGLSLYFSIGNARIWTSISTGFFLIFVSEGYLVAPWAHAPRLMAIHSIVGTIAIMVLTHGFQEYYVFSRTLEAGGSKLAVYLTTSVVVLASVVFLLINPAPSATVLRNIRIIENGNWVFLSLINLDMIRKIYAQVRGTPMARGFVAFALVFALVFLWRGSELYLQVYAWDGAWREVLAALGVAGDVKMLGRVVFSSTVHRVAGLAASVSVGATFLYLFRLLR
ncbi:MAG: hypothetical protein AAB426_10910 [Myxococcota bacterium]